MDGMDDVLKVEERLVLKATENNIPINGTFELLPLCNMNCEMCYIRLSKEEMLKEGHIHSADEWLDIARQMKKLGTIFVLLTGGEPFLYPEFEKLYKGLKKLGMIITINTNGTLITEEIAKMLGKDKPRRVNVTLYGASNDTYNEICHNPYGFDQVINGIQLLKKYNIDVKLNGTLVPQNKNELSKLYEIAHELDLYLKVDTYMFPLHKRNRNLFDNQQRLSAQEAGHYYLLTKKKTYTEEKFRNYKEYMESHICVPDNIDCSLQCRAGKSSFWIQWNGNMTPCVFMNNPGINVFENNFEKSWDYIVDSVKKIQLSLECAQCKYKDICQVCGASCYCETGKFNEKPEYMCEYMKTIIEEIGEMK